MKSKDQDRCEKIIEAYRKGKTLEEVGSDFKVTRERVRQLIRKGLECSIIQSELSDKKSIKTLGLSDRAVNALLRNGISSFTDFGKYTEREILNFRGVGMISLEEILQKIRDHGVLTKGQKNIPKIQEVGTPIDILNFSTRTLNALVRSGITSIEKFSSLSFLKLKNIRGMGAKGIAEASEKLKSCSKNSISSGKEVEEGKNEDVRSNIHDKKIEIEFRKLKKEHRKNKLRRSAGEDIEPRREFLLKKAKKYFFKAKFLKDADIALPVLEEVFPEVVVLLEKNEQERKKKWSWHYVKCLKCGTILVPHRSEGLCEKCYPKSPYAKELQKLSFQKHKEKRKEKVRAYSKEWSKRPEVIERSRRRDDIKKYGGNREKVILGYGSSCAKCRISREEAEKKWKKDFCVIHIDLDSNNNSIENLEPLCYGCFMKRPRKFRKKN